MKKLNKILFAITAGIFTAGVVSASLGEYWSTISHLIPRTNDTVDIGSTAKKVRNLFVNNLTCTDCVDDTNIDWGTGANQVSSIDMPDHNGHSVRDTFTHIINRGKAAAITITETGGLGISWISGELYDSNAQTFFTTDAGSGNLTNHAVNYLKWVSGTALTISTVPPSGDEILVATFSVYDGNISGYRETALMDESHADTRRGLRALFPTRIISGMSVHEDTDATNALDVTMDAGVLYKEVIEKKTPVEIKSRNTAMVRHFHTAGVWDSDTNAQIETTNYDNGTNKTAIPANKYVKGLFIYMSGKIGFVYPTEYFNTVAQAQNASLPTMPTGLEPVPKLTAIVYQQGDTDFTNAVWQDVRAGISEQSFSVVTDHGALAGLSDDDHSQYALLSGRDANSLAIDEIKAYDSAGLKLHDDGGNGIFVKDGGNVGIGTTTPSGTLDVYGDGASIWFGKTQRMQFYGGDAAGTYSPAVYTQTSGRNLRLGAGGIVDLILLDGTSKDVTIKNELIVSGTGDTTIAGNVGIGTTTPANKLEVVGTIKATTLDFVTDLDISDDTNLTAGRSLTLTDDNILADSELYHHEKCFYIEDPTATDDLKSLFHFRKAATITGMWCESDQTVNMDLQLDDGTPADINGTDLVCDSTPADDTSLGGDTGAGAGERLDLVITSVSGTPTWVSICFDFTYND